MSLDSIMMGIFTMLLVSLILIPPASAVVYPPEYYTWTEKADLLFKHGVEVQWGGMFSTPEMRYGTDNYRLKAIQIALERQNELLEEQNEMLRKNYKVYNSTPKGNNESWVLPEGAASIQYILVGGGA